MNARIVVLKILKNQPAIQATTLILSKSYSIRIICKPGCGLHIGAISHILLPKVACHFLVVLIVHLKASLRELFLYLAWGSLTFSMAILNLKWSHIQQIDDSKAVIVLA